MPKDPEHPAEVDAVHEDEILPEYSLKGGVRGKYAERYANGTNLVPLDPEVLEIFPDAESVNRALRALAGIIRVRQAADARGRYEVRSLTPVDVIAAYVLIP